MRGSRDGKKRPYAPLLASSTGILAKLQRIDGSVGAHFPGLGPRVGVILSCFGHLVSSLAFHFIN